MTYYGRISLWDFPGGHYDFRFQELPLFRDVLDRGLMRIGKDGTARTETDDDLVRFGRGRTPGRSMNKGDNQEFSVCVE